MNNLKRNIICKIQLLIPLICFAIGFASTDDKKTLIVVTHLYPHRIMDSDYDLERMEVFNHISKAVIIYDEKEINNVLEALKINSKKPAHLCSFHWDFIHLHGSSIINFHPINIECVAENVAKTLSPYYPDKNSNSFIYTLKVKPEYKEIDVINKIDDSIGRIFIWGKEYDKYPQLNIEYKVKRDFRRKATKSMSSLRCCCRDMLNFFHTKKVVRKNVRELKRSIPAILYLNEQRTGHGGSYISGIYNHGKIDIFMSLDFDSTILDSLNLDPGFTVNFKRPESYNLYLISEIDNLESLRKMIKCEGIVSILKR